MKKREYVLTVFNNRGGEVEQMFDNSLDAINKGMKVHDQKGFAFKVTAHYFGAMLKKDRVIFEKGLTIS